MRYGDDITAPPDGPAQAYRAERLRSAWHDVHIDLVETAPCPGGCLVRAVVRLDGLTPADVVVRLAPAAEAGAEDWPPERRMWSSESYDNGCFLFERVVPTTGPGCDAWAGDWVVAVHPAGALIGRPVMYPLHVGGSHDRQIP